MIELLFAACLTGNPETCVDRSIWFMDQTPEQCRISAGRQLAKWSEVHPRWDVGSWSCAQIDNRAAKLGN